MNNKDETKQAVYNIFDNNNSYVSSFNNYLVAALNRQGIDVVFDKTGPELENGWFFGIKLVLVIFSKSYIFSVACLENLVKLHEFLQEKGHVVVPVFYDESVSGIQEQMEMCEAFAVLEKSFSVDQVTKWRRALVQTMELQGHVYNDKLREESEFIEAIAQDVFEKLYPTENIGIPKVLIEIENLLCKQPWGLRSLGIFGNPGIGKTTLVKAAFRKMSGSYDSYRFIKVSNEKIIELLSDGDFKEIPMEKFDLNNQDAEPCHRSKRVLIVLDDVRNARDAKAFLSGFNRFGPGSLLIITSRHQEVLVQCHVNEIYELNRLGNEDSMKLFTRCFFGEDAIDEKLLKLFVREIERCEGNPSSIRSYAEKMKSKKTIDLEPALGRVCHYLFNYTKSRPRLCFQTTTYSGSITLKQSFLSTTVDNYQSDLKKHPGLDIANRFFVYMLSDLRAYDLFHDSLQQSFLCAPSHNLSDLKDLSRLNVPSRNLESLPSDLRILHFCQESVIACQLNKHWEEYKSFLSWKRMKLGHFKKLIEVLESLESRDIEQNDLRYYTSMESITVTEQLEPHLLNLSGCIRIKRFPKVVPQIRKFRHECQIERWRLQTDHLCLLCNSTNETESHFYFDCTFSRSIWIAICNQIHFSPLRVWKDAHSAIRNPKGSNVKKILSLMVWSSTIYGLLLERNQRLCRRSYQSADVILAQIDRIFRNSASRLRKSRPKIASKVLQLWLGTSSDAFSSVAQ